jgi:undecaprenyl-diphosphatase
MNDILSVIILGLVEGITEFLPVSSTGHLIISGTLLRFHHKTPVVFEIVIQGAAILSVLLIFWSRWRSLFADMSVNFQALSALRPGEARQQLINSVSQTGLFGNAGIAKLIIASTPPAMVGLGLHNYITEYLFSPTPVAVALCSGAVAILWIEWVTNGKGREIDTITYRDALIIGLFQCLALWPGMSRAAWSIVGAMSVGLSRRAAAEFSFLAAVPLILSAAGYELLAKWSTLETGDLFLLALGCAVSFATAALAVTTFLGLLQRFSLRPFAYYRLALAAIVLIVTVL